jgi:hypothetical protein
MKSKNSKEGQYSKICKEENHHHHHPHGIGHWPVLNQKSTANHSSHSMVTPIAQVRKNTENRYKRLHNYSKASLLGEGTLIKKPWFS